MISLLAGFAFPDRAQGQEFIVGGDVSSLRAVLDNGGSYQDSGQTEDALYIMKEHGFNWVRAKLWHTPYDSLTADPEAEKPADPYNGLEDVVQTAVEAKAQGLMFLLDFHYSDTWADPGRQYKPEAWADISDINLLADSLYNYTLAVMTRLKNAGALPDMVQLGNEINFGMLWPQGNPYNGGSWSNLGMLLNAGVQAVRDAEGESDSVLIMIHHADGSSYFFQNVLDQGVHVDYWGRSYYPQWHGTLSDLTNNLEQLDAQFPNQGVVVVETGYRWTAAVANDGKGNALGSGNDLYGYPASVEGQRQFLIKLRNIVDHLPNGHGAGVFYWEPAWLPVDNYGSPMENATLFDWNGNTLPSINGLATDTTYPPPPPEVNLTLRFNTATVRDTLKSNNLLLVLGEFIGYTGLVLSDGRDVSWGKKSSELFATNVGGDYWELTMPVISGDTFKYKLWAGRSISEYGNYEGQVTAGNGLVGDTRMLVVPETDTTFQLEFFNGTGMIVDQYWRPYEVYEDSITIRYRVNMAHVMGTATFTESDLAGIGGTGPLSGPSPKARNFMTREEFSVAGGSFWHFDVRIPASAVSDSGFHQNYKFTVLRDSLVWFAESELRYLTLTETFAGNDTTLHWVFYDDYSMTSRPEEGRAVLPRTSSITSAYPNPFNGEVRVVFTVRRSGPVELAVFNLLGQRVATLVRGVKGAGEHETVWEGRSTTGHPVPSGTYLLRLSSGDVSQQRKITLVR